MAAFASGFQGVAMRREDQRANLVLTEATETVCLYSWDQLYPLGFIPTNSTDYQEDMAIAFSFSRPQLGCSNLWLRMPRSGTPAVQSSFMSIGNAFREQICHRPPVGTKDAVKELSINTYEK